MCQKKIMCVCGGGDSSQGVPEVHKNNGEGFVSTINPCLNAFPGYLERNKNALYWLEFEHLKETKLELSFLPQWPGRPLIDMKLLSLN
jgi:hypothetical protein